MDGTEQLCSLDKTAAQRRFKSRYPQPLKDSLSELMEQRISPRHKRCGPLFELWERLLPAELSKHCRPDGFRGGQLRVTVDAPSYLYELQLCSGELLSELQQQCPGARIKKIKFVIKPD
jgi:predicted nucleic acid-binding Zn ribbon protein